MEIFEKYPSFVRIKIPAGTPPKPGLVVPSELVPKDFTSFQFPIAISLAFS